MSDSITYELPFEQIYWLSSKDYRLLKNKELKVFPSHRAKRWLRLFYFHRPFVGPGYLEGSSRQAEV